MLSPEALIERRKGIGGSDAAKIMGGDADWYDLWLDKTGRKESDDLSHVWAVQLGVATESLNLDWYERKMGYALESRGRVCVSEEWPILRATLDGYDGRRPAVIECKHVNGFSKMPDVQARYTPQVIHQMICSQTPNGFLSVIVGSNQPEIVEIDYDDFWASEYVDRCLRFWSYVEGDEEPPGAPAAAPLPIATDKMRVVDFTGDNEWATFAADYLANRNAAALFEAAKNCLKNKVQPDVRKAKGHGIIVSRSKAGALTIKEAK